jgi:hypothetical protein
MTIYLDDDSVQNLLYRLLLNAGHKVTLPDQASLAGGRDSEHMTYAVETDCVLLTRNHKDFNSLHSLIHACGGHHPGIIVVRLDDDKRDLKPHEIVAAIGRLARAVPDLTDQYQFLNHWR